jgi:calcium-dependent protein kinase
MGGRAGGFCRGRGRDTNTQNWLLTLTNTTACPRDPEKRPTAKEALKHPWLRGNSADRASGAPIEQSVVQRIQRFAQSSLFKRGVFQLIAEELLARPGGALAALAASASQQDLADASMHSVRSAGGMSVDGDDEDAAGGRPFQRPPAAASLQSFSSSVLGAVAPGPEASGLRELYRKLPFDGPSGSPVDAALAAEALGSMGFRLMPSEAAQLVEMLDSSRSGRVKPAAFAASQIDWAALQRRDVGAWIDIAQRAFSRLDTDRDGVISPDEIVASLRAKLPEDELRVTMQQVAAEAGADGGPAPGLDFESFLNLLRVSFLGKEGVGWRVDRPFSKQGKTSSQTRA